MFHNHSQFKGSSKTIKKHLCHFAIQRFLQQNTPGNPQRYATHNAPFSREEPKPQPEPEPDEPEPDEQQPDKPEPDEPQPEEPKPKHDRSRNKRVVLKITATTDAFPRILPVFRYRNQQPDDNI